MKYISEPDNNWHVINEEMPPRSTYVEFLKKDGTIVEGEIFVDMSGWYASLNGTWGSLSDYTHWRFNEK